MPWPDLLWAALGGATAAVGMIGLFAVMGAL